MSLSNLSASNRPFKKALHEPVKSLYHYNGCGFFDGGCLLLADALILWSKNALTHGGIVRQQYQDRVHVDHWFAGVNIGGNQYCLDANGLKTHQAFKRYWTHSEGLGTVIFRPNANPELESEIPRDLVFSALLAGQIQQALGDFDSWTRRLAAPTPAQEATLG